MLCLGKNACSVAPLTGRNSDICQVELIFALPDDKEGDGRVEPHRLVERHVQIGQLLNALVVGMVIILK